MGIHKQSQPHKVRTQNDPPDKYPLLEAPAAPRRKGTVKEILAMRERGGYERNNPAKPIVTTSPPQEIQSALNKPNQKTNRLRAFRQEVEEQERKQNIPQRRKSSLGKKTTTSTESEDEYDAGMEKMRLQQNRLLKGKKQVNAWTYGSTGKGAASVATKDMAQTKAITADNKRIHSPEFPDHSASSLNDETKSPLPKAPKRIRFEDYSRTRESAHIPLRCGAAERCGGDFQHSKQDIAGNQFGEEHGAYITLEEDASSTARKKLLEGKHAQNKMGLERSKPDLVRGFNTGIKAQNLRQDHKAAAEPRKREAIVKRFKDDVQKKAEISKVGRRQKGLDALYDNLLAKTIPLVRGSEVVLDEAYTEETWCRQLAERIERTVDNDGRTDHNAYVKKCRSILFNLKKNETLFTRLIAGSVAPEHLAKMSAEQMISEEEREWRENERERATTKCTLVKQTQEPHIRKTHKGEELVEDIHQRSSREPISDSLFSSPELRPLNVDENKTALGNKFCLSKVHAQIPPIQHPILGISTSKQGAANMENTASCNNFPQARGIPSLETTGLPIHPTLNQQGKPSPLQRGITRGDGHEPFDADKGWNVLKAPGSSYPRINISDQPSVDGYRCKRHCSPPYAHQRCDTPPYSPPITLTSSPTDTVVEVRGSRDNTTDEMVLTQDQEESTEEEWPSQPRIPFYHLTAFDDLEITGSRNLVGSSAPAQNSRPLGGGELQDDCTTSRSNQEECSEEEWPSQPRIPFYHLTAFDDLEITGSRNLVGSSAPAQNSRPLGGGELQDDCTTSRSNQEECSEEEWPSQPRIPFYHLTAFDDLEITGSRNLVDSSAPAQNSRPHGGGGLQANCTTFRSNQPTREPPPASYQIGDDAILKFGTGEENDAMWGCSPKIKPYWSTYHQEPTNMDNRHNFNDALNSSIRRGHEERAQENGGLSESYEYQVQQPENLNPVDLQARHQMSSQDYDNRYRKPTPNYQYSTAQVEVDIGKYWNAANSTSFPATNGLQGSVQGANMDSQHFCHDGPQAHQQLNRTGSSERGNAQYSSSSYYPHERSSYMLRTQPSPSPTLDPQTGPEYSNPAVRIEPLTKLKPENIYPGSVRGYEPRCDTEYR